MARKEKSPIFVYYVWIALITVIGVALTLYLIPDESGVAYIAFQAQRYEKARAYYEQQYQAGVRSPDLLFRLGELELKQGHVDQSIRYMEELVNTYPNNLSALNYLKNLYESNQKYDKYIETVEKINTIQKERNIVDIGTMEKLSQWQTTQNQPEKAVDTLRNIIATHRGSEKNYIDLATLLVKEKKYDEALRVLEERKKMFPEALKLDDLFLEIWAITKQGELTKSPEAKNQSISLLSQYLFQKKNPDETESALDFISSNYPSWSPLFIQKIHPLIAGNLILEQASATMLWYYSTGESDKQYASVKLTEAYKDTPKDPELQNLYFEMIQTKNYPALVADFLKRGDVSNLSPESLSNFSDWAQQNRQEGFAYAMRYRLSSEFLKRYPAVDISLLIAACPCDAAIVLKAFLRVPHPKAELLHLFNMTVAAKMEQEALSLGSDLLKLGGFSSDELAEIAYGYIQLNHADEFQKQLTCVRPKTSLNDQAAALALLNADRKYSAKVATWLSTQQQVSESVLNYLYSIASNREEYPLALYVAKRIQTTTPSVEADANYAVSLVRVGKVDKGMSLIRAIYEKRPNDTDVQDDYFDALLAATRFSPKYREELSLFLHKQEARGCLTPDLLRTYASAYLENLRDIEKAKKLYFDLVLKGCYTQDDLDILLDLWGPCVTPEQGCFILTFAASSPDCNLSFWLERLNSIGMYCEVVSIVQKRLENDLPLEAYFAYMDALTRLHYISDLKNTINFVYSKVSKLKDIAQLANLAGAVQYYEMQRIIWEKGVNLYPEDMLAWQALADVASYQNDDCTTRAALRNFFFLYNQGDKPVPTLYVSLYEYGVIMARHCCFREARNSFFAALAYIRNCGIDTVESKAYEALILQELDAPALALCKMAQFYKMSSQELEAAADYSQMMMDVGAWSSARYLIGKTIGY